MNSLIFFAQAGVDESLFVWYVKACGPIFSPLFVLISIVFVTLAIMNWLAISRNAIVPTDMIEQFHEKLKAKEFQEAYEIAKGSDSTLGKIFAVGLVKMSENAAASAALRVSAAEQAMNDTAEEEVMALEHRLGYLGTVASVSPMVGLLGTVGGMIWVFNILSSGGPPQASELAGGIALALVTTQIGLLIAIPALVFFEVFKTRLARYTLEISLQTENVLNRFKQN